LLKDRYNQSVRQHHLEAYTHCVGLGPRTVIAFKNAQNEDWWALKSLFQQECIKRGVLFTGSHNMSYAHTEEDILQTAQIYDEVIELCAEAISGNAVERLLEGPPVVPVFRKA
jgi:glutamate-1-semialdehyde aminotransferase